MKLLSTIALFFSLSSSFAQIYTQGRVTGKDSCDFSSNCSIVKLDSASGNTWALSNTTSKVLLANGLNDSFALITDTARYYSTNTTSSFTVFKNTGEDFNYTDMNFLLSFYHKMNSDSAHDGGFIEISYDNGQTWKNVITDPINLEHNQPVFGLNMYTQGQLLANGEPGFSGNIAEWTLVEIPITRLVMTKKPNAAHFRFTFVSDSIADEKEGWIIDNLKLSQVDIPGGLNKLNSASQIFNMGPNPCTDNLTLTARKENISGQLSIYSVEGKLVSRVDLVKAKTKQIHTRDLPAGLFSIIYQDEQGNQYVQKFIKAE